MQIVAIGRPLAQALGVTGLILGANQGIRSATLICGHVKLAVSCADFLNVTDSGCVVLRQVEQSFRITSIGRIFHETPAMILGAEDIDFIKAHIGEWLAEESLGKPPKVYELELRERSVRIEEQLKHQRDLIQTIIEQNDKRFDALQRQIDQRFEATWSQMGQRFEAVQSQMDQRFEAIERRFEAMQTQMDQRFDAMQMQMDKRFDAVDKRFEAMDTRFEALTRRIDRFMFWSLGLTISVAGLIIAMVRIWPAFAA